METFLAPTLKAGRIVMMDNLKAHKTQRVREMIEAKGCEVMFLPTYSPELNPIEEAFSKIKSILRAVGARTREALLDGHKRSDQQGNGPGCEGLLRRLRVPSTSGPMFMRTAVAVVC